MDANNFVGIPYKHGGASHEGADCWGLVRLVEMELFDVFLPSVIDELSIDREKELRANKCGVIDIQKVLDGGDVESRFIPTDSPQDGDIALLHYMNVPCHTGVIVNCYLLHADPLCRGTSRMSRLTDMQIAPRIERFYHVA
jgi:hypothetical protein